MDREAAVLATISVVLLALFVAYAGVRMLQPLLTTWGATPAEMGEQAPGEDRLADPRIASTLAVTIDAPPADVWPWLVQLGVGRGGSYSYAWLENLVGCGVRNVEEIVPALQTLKEGDPIVLHPGAPPLHVTLLEPGRALALEGWVFYLKPMASHTRLVSRTYVRPRRPEASRALRLLDLVTRSVWFDVAHFIMQRKQLLEIKRLAERGTRCLTRPLRVRGASSMPAT